MLERLKPFRAVAAAVFALLLAAIFAGPDTQQPTQRASSQPLPVVKPSQPADLRPAPKIGPATLVYKVETKDPVAFLTIDDGGYRDPAMAGVLNRNGVKATMFVTQKYARQDPAFFRQLRDDTGSAIENHSATHANLKGRPADQQAAEIGPVSDDYAATFGKRPTLFRAPFGNSDDITLQAAGEAGAKYVVNWGSEIRNGKVHFSGPREFRPGSIVLMHFGPGFEADVNAFVAQARTNGLTPALLTDYLR
ncbi:peptidoglycan/xylan/chitin deacetylase (PgdA/CDA1 family) [Kibdelosporangium banguiense]|uniref:Peptidoglycan/xylan/chitin deacetylase (PgdA/CDA1 family) n=1 Tax=Kibdelosporangium banguiense TaxID=1365924 RepID=A0ABS4T6J5_9PSEU|nr:polysaccharide deacetylase family protein [Kibdelosporangium banguiense]MBP2320050.1 peptidoglycan/xylan/chitin deacetylase (PgdA/CDA1 family) [Kibdelosporangium banguiense]